MLLRSITVMYLLRLCLKTEEEQEGEGKKEEKGKKREATGEGGCAVGGWREGGNCSLTLVGIQRLHLSLLKYLPCARKCRSPAR